MRTAAATSAVRLRRLIPSSRSRGVAPQTSRPGSVGPGADAGDAVGRDVDDVAGGRVVHRRELDARPEVDLGEPLEQLGRAAALEAGGAADDQVVVQAHLVGTV